MVTEAQKDAQTKWRKKAYDQIMFYADKGKRDIIKEYATKSGLSQNQYINMAIDSQLIKDGYKPDQAAEEPGKE